MANRIGFGYDIHPFKEGRRLFLGGVEIPHPAGLAGHSDGDALIHAVIDALLGAAGEGDIGRLFPDSEAKYKDIRSTRLLEEVVMNLKKKGVGVVNIDTVVVAEEPRLAPHVEKMKKVLCPILGLKRNELGIKGKTNERLGVIGKRKAVACWAVALIRVRSGRGRKKA